MATKTDNPANHKSYLDVVRLAAILLVYFVHTGTRGAAHYMIEGGIVSYFTAFTLQAMSFAGPSIFFAISGGLLLPKETDLKKLLTKRIPKYILIIVFFNLFQLYYSAINSPEMLNNPFLALLNMIYGYVLITQYWFLNAYLVFLLLLPVLSAAAKGMSKRAFEYLFCVFFVIEFVLKIAEYFMKTERIALSFGPWESLLIAPFAGYYIEKYFDDFLRDTKKMIVLNIVTVVSLAIHVWYLNLMYTEELSGGSLNGATLLLAFTIYANIKMFFTDKTLKENTVRVLKVLGDGVFMAYLLENQMKDLYIVLYDKTVNSITWVGACALWLIPGILTAILIRFLLSLIPGVKKIIP